MHKTDWKKLMKEGLIRQPEKIERVKLAISFPEVYPQDILIDQANQTLAKALGVDIKTLPQITTPPPEIKADLAVPMFTMAKTLRKAPQQIASDIAKNTELEDGGLISSLDSEGPYLNLSIDYGRYGQMVVSSIESSGPSYGAENIGKNDTIVIDMSSPNVAKPMHVAHLRSTVIGHSLARMLEFQGYNVIKDNHLGDWGAQFGMVLKAIEMWGDETPELFEKGQEVKGLLKLYVRINESVENEKGAQVEKLKSLIDEKGFSAVDGFETAYNRAYADAGSKEEAMKEALNQFTTETELEAAGRELFRNLEQGDPESTKKWEEIMPLSLKEFQEVYDLLGVDFDFALGESFYNNMLPYVVEEVKKQPFVEITEDGAVVADLEDAKLGKMVIQTRDGRSLYVTRDLATAMFRDEYFKANQIKYVVGGEQIFYFKQCFEILKRMGYDVADKCEHIYFGAVVLPEGKMSTRKGRIVFLRDVLEESIARASKIIEAKNPNLSGESRDKVARQVGVGAVIWNDLGKDAKRTITFKWDEMLSTSGFSATFVQYAHSRAANILRKAEVEGSLQKTYDNISDDKLTISKDVEKDLIKLLAEFPSIVKKASASETPSTIAVYIYDLAQKFNKFYDECPVIKADGEVKATRLRLVASTKQVIKNGLYLLGIESPEEM